MDRAAYLEAAEFFEDVLTRVDMTSVNEDLVVQVGSGASARRSDEADDLAPLNALADTHLVGSEVSVSGHEPVVRTVHAKDTGLGVQYLQVMLSPRNSP